MKRATVVNRASLNVSQIGCKVRAERLTSSAKRLFRQPKAKPIKDRACVGATKELYINLSGGDAATFLVTTAPCSSGE
jgi:hypothetical protein